MSSVGDGIAMLPGRLDTRLPLASLPEVQPGQGFDLLAGIRILDLTTSVAGPFATMLLADMGAEVLKIERPGTGDDARAWGPPFLDGESLWFLSVNRNKRSLCLDYAKPEGLQVLRELAARSDVVVVNQPPRVAAKLGVDPQSLRSIQPDLIYVSINGFGLAGERSDWTCYDLIAEGYSGVMDLTGEPDGEPQKVGAPAADLLAGQDAAFATVAALFARCRNGQGRTVDIALDRFDDTLFDLSNCSISRVRRPTSPLGREGQRDRHLSSLRDRRSSDHARLGQRQYLEPILASRG